MTNKKYTFLIDQIQNSLRIIHEMEENSIMLRKN